MNLFCCSGFIFPRRFIFISRRFNFFVASALFFFVALSCCRSLVYCCHLCFVAAVLVSLPATLFCCRRFSFFVAVLFCCRRFSFLSPLYFFSCRFISLLPLNRRRKHKAAKKKSGQKKKIKR